MKNEQLSFRVPKSLKERIKAVAIRDVRTPSQVAEMALNRGLPYLEEEILGIVTHKSSAKPPRL